MSVSVSRSVGLSGQAPTVFLESAPAGLLAEVDSSIERACLYLASLQAPEGYWVGELEADTTLESDTIKFMHWLGRVDPDKQARLARTILQNQNPDGGWPIYWQGPSDLSASVKAYVALKLAGYPEGDPVLQRARETILRLGGLERINSFEKVYLALFGAYPWDQVPALPPELVLLPTWFYFNIYEVSYWSRTILVPLSVIYATRPMAKWTGSFSRQEAAGEKVPVPFSLSLDELWVDPNKKRARMTNLQAGGWFWRRFFLLADRLLKLYEASSIKPWRAKALRVADRWITERLIETDGLGAIFPAMLNATIALKGLGYEDGDPLFEQQVKELQRLELPDGLALKVQPCFSPIWDTALAVTILGKATRASQELAGASGEAASSRSHLIGQVLQRGVKWLLLKEVRRWGDWRIKNRQGRPGGWAFEFRNPVYPDVDDTAQVLLALGTPLGTISKRAGFSAEPCTFGNGTEGAFRRGLDWLLSMQNRDGGWSSFDKDNDCEILTHFPFADHNAMLDPSCPDITGRVLELLATAGFSRAYPSVRRAIGFLKSSQQPDGTWFGRWGVNYIYGTWLALRGLRAMGEPMDSLAYQRAGRWILRVQNPDGGWGESCRSYDDPTTKGKGPSTASQTAWALMALMSLGLVAEPGFQRGLRFLLSNQQGNGNWEEEPFTGTGFPRVFYLKYHLYRTYFPLMALLEAKRTLLKGTLHSERSVP